MATTWPLSMMMWVIVTARGGIVGAIPKRSAHAGQRVRDKSGYHKSQNDEKSTKDEWWPRNHLSYQTVQAVAAFYTNVGVAITMIGELRLEGVDEGVLAVDGLLLREVDVEQGKDEAEHGRTEAIAQTTHPRNHALH